MMFLRPLSHNLHTHPIRFPGPRTSAFLSRFSNPRTQHQTPRYIRQKCSHTQSTSNLQKTPCKSQTISAPPLNSLPFWTSPPTWKRASINTLRCLVGCTLGDFSAMWYLQAYHAELGMSAIMGISMISGISTSIALETLLLRFGKDLLPWAAAFKTATGMSLISMLTMEVAENAVDFHLTGGVVQFDSPAFWGAAVLSIAAGFVAPLPWNYVRLRKFGRACH